MVDEIIANKYAKTASPALKATDISGVSDPNATVALKCIRDPTNVNALLEAQELTFAEIGLTVVFGDNASGKSGYARIIKDVASARHHEPIHVNVFEANANTLQKARITYLLDGKEEPSAWPNAADDLKARGVHLFDLPAKRPDSRIRYAAEFVPPRASTALEKAALWLGDLVSRAGPVAQGCLPRKQNFPANRP